MLASPRSVFCDGAVVAKLLTCMAAATIATAALPIHAARNDCGGKDAGVPAQVVGIAALVLWLGADARGPRSWIAGMLPGERWFPSPRKRGEVKEAVRAQ